MALECLAGVKEGLLDSDLAPIDMQLLCGKHTSIAGLSLEEYSFT